MQATIVDLWLPCSSRECALTAWNRLFSDDLGNLSSRCCIDTSGTDTSAQPKIRRCVTHHRSPPNEVSIMNNSASQSIRTRQPMERRAFLFHSLRATLSATAIALMAGKPQLLHAAAASDAQLTNDIQILSAALAAEREAIAAYQLGADSGLLDSGTLKVAVTFQGHHAAHAGVLANTIQQLGGNVAAPPGSYAFPTDKLKEQRDVLIFAASLERGAVTAYASAIPQFDNRDLSKAAASILADEAMHWAVLRQALGMDPVPGAFFS
jgi:hypothetical protein